jgi:enoyl-[acyl-carrier protein] reductase II
MSKTLDNLWKKGTDFLGTKHAIMCGAMSWVSEHNLVSAISNAGGFGVLACGALTPEQLSHEIKMTKERTRNPFGVNVITMHPNINELIQVCIDENVSHIVLGGGLPKASLIQKAKESNAKVMCFAPTLSIAQRLVSNGANAIVVEGSEAGGHIGPTSTSVLAQMILPYIKEVPVFVAGGIGRGDIMASYLIMGAAGCQLGTRFVCTHESIAHPNFKNAFIKATARDTTVSVQIDPSFPVIPVRSIANKATQAFATAQSDAIISFEKGELTKTEAQLKIEKFWAGALRRAVIDGDVEHGSLMAGESVDMVTKEQSTEEVIQDLLAQANACLAAHAATAI